MGYVGLDAANNSAGMFLCWSKSRVISVSSISKNAIVCSVFDHNFGNYNVAIVYGSPYIQERNQIWSSLSDILDSTIGAWLLIGDFNQVETQEQKLGGKKIPRSQEIHRVENTK